MKHELVNNTLVTEKDGIAAHCVCGWSSRAHFSGMAASVAFEGHCLAEIGASKTGEGEDEDAY